VVNTSDIALFPLNTVLFPQGPLPLRIFETRYTDMVKRCMREESCFGVVLVSGGGDTGEAAVVAQIGTTARIVDFHLLEDGLLGITCLGQRRFKVLSRWRQVDGLNMANVEWLAQSPLIAVPGEYWHLADVLRRVLPELGSIYADIKTHFDDADWVGARLLEIMPLSLGEKQQCLEMDDPIERLAHLAPFIRRE